MINENDKMVINKIWEFFKDDKKCFIFSIKIVKIREKNFDYVYYLFKVFNNECINIVKNFI